MVRSSYTGPAHPIGYVELQVGWVGLKTADDLRTIIEELRAKGLSEHPGFVQHGARMETTTDGAAVPHYVLYMGFAPAVPSSEPLDPHNMNDARDQILKTRINKNQEIHVSGTQPLVGDVKTQFVVVNGDPHDLSASINAARLEQEAMCGYPLVIASWRHTEVRNARGDLEIEVFATFAPAEQN